MKITFGLHLAFQPSFWPYLFWFLESNHCFLWIILLLLLINFFFIFSYVEEYEEDFWPLFGLLWPLLNTTGIIGRYTENCSKISMQMDQLSFLHSVVVWSLKWPLLGLYVALTIFWLFLKAFRLTIDKVWLKKCS